MLLVSFARPGFAQQRPALDVALSRDTAPEATVRINGLLTDQVFNALESGFPLYVHYVVTLRELGGIFGGRVAQEFEYDYVVLTDPVRDAYTIKAPEESRDERGRAALERWVSRPFAFGLVADRAGRYLYQVRVEARTLSDEDMDDAFAWLKGEGSGAATSKPGLFTRAARRLLVTVMPLPSFELEGKSEVFWVGANGRTEERGNE